MRRVLRRFACVSESWAATAWKITGFVLLVAGVVLFISVGNEPRWLALAITCLATRAALAFAGFVSGGRAVGSYEGGRQGASRRDEGARRESFPMDDC